MSWKLPSSAGTRLLCLPGRRSPYLTRQSSWKPHRHLGCPLLPSGCGVCRAARVQSPPLPGGGDPSSRSSSSLPLQPPPPPRAPSTDPPSCPLDSIPGPVLPPGPWGARTVHLGVPPCSPRPHLLLASQPDPPRPSPRFSVPLELPACPSAPPPWPLTLSQDPRVTCPGSGSLHSVRCHQNKEGILVGSHPFFLMTHHDGVTASFPEEGVSLCLVQSPAPLPGHCYPPLPPCPSPSLAACA